MSTERTIITEKRIELTTSSTSSNECIAEVTRQYRYGDDVAGVSMRVKACYVCDNIIQGTGDEAMHYLEEHLLDYDGSDTVNIIDYNILHDAPLTVQVVAGVQFASVQGIQGMWESDVELIYHALSYLDTHMGNSVGQLHPHSSYPARGACSTNTTDCSVLEQLVHSIVDGGVEIIIEATHSTKPLIRGHANTTALAALTRATARFQATVDVQRVLLKDFNIALALDADALDATLYAMRHEQLLGIISEYYDMRTITADDYFILLTSLAQATYNAILSITK